MLQEFFNQIWLDFAALDVWVYVAAACLVLAFAVQGFYQWVVYCSVFRYARKCAKGKVEYSTTQPAVSVIVCAKNEAENLEANLPAILEQVYPDFEVIVVDDGSCDDTPDVLKRLSAQYPRLKTRTIPADAKHVSPKKFAMSLGIKAASNDILLFTDADCRPTSPQWIGTMARNFTEGTDLVLGYGSYSAEKGFASRLVSYDTISIALQYFGYTLVLKPYMGVGRNMAYRKSFFNSTRGFGSHLDLQSGDDDLFVNEYARKARTRIECSPDSITISAPKRTLKEFLTQKSRHLTTYGRYSFSSKLSLGVELATRVLFYAAFVCCIASLDILSMSVAALLFLCRTICMYAITNKAAKTFGDKRRFYCGLVFYDIFIPLFNLAAKCAKQRKWK